MNKRIMEAALKSAGYRERFAIENGKPRKKTVNGRVLYVFEYSSTIKYQDANGATFDATNKQWID